MEGDTEASLGVSMSTSPPHRTEAQTGGENIIYPKGDFEFGQIFWNLIKN